MVGDAESHAEDDKRLRELAEARNNAENAAYQAEKQVKDLGEQLDEASKREIEAAIKDVREALESEDADDIRAKTDAPADGVPQGLRADVRARAGRAGRRRRRPTATARPTAPSSASEEEVVDAEVVDEQK